MINDKKFTDIAMVDFGVIFAYNKLELIWIIIGRYEKWLQKSKMNNMEIPVFPC